MLLTRQQAKLTNYASISVVEFRVGLLSNSESVDSYHIYTEYVVQFLFILLLPYVYQVFLTSRFYNCKCSFIVLHF